MGSCFEEPGVAVYPFGPAVKTIIQHLKAEIAAWNGSMTALERKARLRMLVCAHISRRPGKWLSIPSNDRTKSWWLLWNTCAPTGRAAVGGGLDQHLGFSRARVFELFTAETGLAPHHYLVRLRLEKATELLQNTRLSITEIALATGFASGEQLSRVFRTYRGETPSECRKNMGGCDRAVAKSPARKKTGRSTLPASTLPVSGQARILSPWNRCEPNSPSPYPLPRGEGACPAAGMSKRHNSRQRLGVLRLASGCAPRPGAVPTCGAAEALGLAARNPGAEGLAAVVAIAQEWQGAGVPPGVVRGLKQLEVMGAIVKPVAVAMVDMLVAEEPALEDVLHDQAVQEPRLTAQADDGVAVAVDAAAKRGAAAQALRAGQRPRF